MTQSGNLTTVKFDLSFDAATYNSSKISGAVIDLAYNSALLLTGESTASSPTFTRISGATPPVWALVQTNLEGGGVIALVTDPTPAAFTANPIIDTAASNKILSVTLIINSLVNSFNIGFDAGKSSLTLADDSKPTPTVGISKTAYKTGISATSVEANTLIMVKDTNSLGTVTDNQFRFLDAVDAQNNKTGSVKFQYDTNPAVGATTLSDVVAINLISADALSSFLTSSTSFKVI